MDIKQIITDAVYADDYFPMTVAQWSVDPSLSAFSADKIAKALRALEKEYVIVLSKKGKVLPFTESDLRCGVFRASTRGFGFVDCVGRDKTTETFFLAGSNRAGALHGDTVLVRVLSLPKSDREGEAKVERVLTRAITEVVGTIEKKQFRQRRKPTLWFLVPDDRRIAPSIEIVLQKGQQLREGDKALLAITLYPNAACPFQGKIVRVFGRGDSTAASYEAILYAHRIKPEFPKAVLAECDRVAALPISPEGRLDLRTDERRGVIFSIDGADAKDLDDAVSLSRTESGHYLLGVHIADVSEYVRASSATDTEALSRGCSVYFVDQVVPMLPRSLSNGACSLNENEDRYALSALMEIDRQGNTVRAEFHRSVIRSRLRGVYSEVNDVIARGADSPFAQKYASVADVLPSFCELYEILLKKRQAGGMLELTTVESKIHLDESGRPITIEKRQVGLAEQIIEQCMLCANEAVASFCKCHAIPCVYRVHAAPPEEKLHAFTLFANQCNLSLAGLPADNAEVRPMHLRAILEQAKDKGLGSVVSAVLLRSLSKAVYAPQSALHFGLGMEPYCHFTSPIRRYPDLCVHRILKDFLFGEWNEGMAARYATFTVRAASESSENELRALYAERDIEELYKMLYLAERIGECYEATVSSLTAFGIFVQLENTCEGMIPLSSLDGYAVFDEATVSLRVGRKTYHLADAVSVQLTDVDLDTRRATFRLLPEDEPILKKGGSK